MTFTLFQIFKFKNQDISTIFRIRKMHIIFILLIITRLNMIKVLSQGLFLLYLIYEVAGQVAPTWITSPYIQAASKKIIDGDLCTCKTGNTSTPTATMTFTTAFSAPPNLGFGVTNYQSDDYLGQEMFQINRTALTTSTFSVKMQITGYTNLWMLEVRYVGISISFPHHLNSFDNVPVNYTKGALVNISTTSSTMTTYQNIVNYTAQATAAGLTYKYFSLPLTNNKVLLFMTSMFITGTVDFGSTSNPISLTVTATPWSIDTYRIYVTLYHKAAISRLHFSMITFDQYDVQLSGMYLIVYDRIQYTQTGGFYSFPSQFLTNFMIGFTQFSSAKCLNTIYFVLNFVTISGSYGVQMTQSTPIKNQPPLIRFNYTLFYLKTWLCPNTTVFDPTTNLCVPCPLLNCNTCFNISICSVCNQAIGYYVNTTSGLCQTCTISGCVNCSGILTCSDCNETSNYVLSNTTCTLCQQSLNYFANNSTQTCVLCTLNYCINCSSLTQCISCNTSLFYYVNGNGTCSYCDPGLNFLIDPVTKTCQNCTLSNCANCSTLTTCRTCISPYLLNTTNNLCQPCTISNCITCSSFTSCSICNATTGYTQNPTTGLCQLCSLVGCISCTTTIACAQCNTTLNYVLVSGVCQLCSAGTFVNSTTDTCTTCSLSNCVTCTSLITCGSCNTGNSYYLSGTTCSYCDPLTNKYINTTTLTCQTCSIPNCVNCSSLTTCQQCSPSYILNGTQCQLCVISNCLVCTFAICVVCDTASGYALNPNTGLCQVCPITGCANCSTISVCVQCNITQNYVLIGNSCQLCTPGTFANTTTHACDSCGLSNCNLCLTLTSCATCDSGNSYYINSAGSCSYCDPATNKFINGTLNCETCSIANCVTCTSLTDCSACNATAFYYVNTTDHQCYPCTITGCISCYTLYNCSLCNMTAGYTINTATGLCEICSLAGCTNCTDTLTCAECNATANYAHLANDTCELCNISSNYFPNVNNTACQLCALNECAVCASLTICSSCNIGNFYYLLNNTCTYCDPALNYLINTTSFLCQTCTIPNCDNCSTLSTCRTCDTLNGFFINSTDSLCYPCSLSFCLTCYYLTNCSICDNSAGYTINLATGLCQLCSIVGCNNCSDTLTCVQCSLLGNYILLSNNTCERCDNSSNLFANSTSNACEVCTLSDCLTCQSLTVCQLCNTSALFYVSASGPCSYCDPSFNDFINLTTLGCQTCQIPNCLNCSSLTTCRECNTYVQSFLNETTQLCQYCSISYCFSCVNLTMCAQCDQSSLFFLNYTSGNCQPCALQNCIICSSLTSCLECDHFNNFGFDQTSVNASKCGPCNVSCTCDGYAFPWNNITQQCTPVCGDGFVRLGEQCDDGNTFSGDGCSSYCTVEIFYTCISEPSYCNRTLQINAEFTSIEKDGCNSFKLYVYVENYDLNQIYQYINILNSGIMITNKQQKGSEVIIYGAYSRSILNQTILLKFTPGPLLNITYNPTIPPIYYNEDECKTQNQVQQLVKASEIVSYVILLFSLLSCKIVGLQLFGVLQLSFFTLSAHSFLNAYLSPLLKFKTFNGLNIGLTQESSPPPENYAKMSLSSSFINNCNIMLILLFAQLIVSLTIYIVGRIKKNQKTQSIGKRLLKQGFITLVLFNILNISFSAGVHLKYADPQDEGYLISTIILFGTLAAMVISVIAMELTSGQHYGQFKNKFKNVWICRLYIPLTICYRMLLGFYIALKSDYQQGTLIILAFSLAFVMFFVVNLPFTNVYQNYRGGFIHMTMLYTLLTTNYYQGMKSTTPMQIKGRIYAPAIIQLVLIVGSIAFSFIILIYEMYQILRDWRKGRIIQKLNERNQTEQSLENINVSNVGK